MGICFKYNIKAMKKRKEKSKSRSLANLPEARMKMNKPIKALFTVLDMIKIAPRIQIETASVNFRRIIRAMSMKNYQLSPFFFTYGILFILYLCLWSESLKWRVVWRVRKKEKFIKKEKKREKEGVAFKMLNYPIPLNPIYIAQSVSIGACMNSPTES